MFVFFLFPLQPPSCAVFHHSHWNYSVSDLFVQVANFLPILWHKIDKEHSGADKERPQDHAWVVWHWQVAVEGMAVTRFSPQDPISLLMVYEKGSEEAGIFHFLFCVEHNRHASNDTIAWVSLNCSLSFRTFACQVPNKKSILRRATVSFLMFKRSTTLCKRKHLWHYLSKNFLLFPHIFKIDFFPPK